MIKFINTELESESDSELFILIQNNCNVFTHRNFVVNHGWLLTDFK